jgi:hypothetical protein
MGGHTCRALASGEARYEDPAKGGAARPVVAAAGGGRPRECVCGFCTLYQRMREGAGKRGNKQRPRL